MTSGLQYLMQLNSTLVLVYRLLMCRWRRIQNYLLRQHVQHPTLHFSLQVADVGKITWYDEEDLIQQTSGLYTGRLGGVRLSDDHKAMTRDRVPRNDWRTKDEAMDVERSNFAQLGDPKVSRFLLGIPKINFRDHEQNCGRVLHTRFLGI
jgi:hypothetical protein